MGMVGWGECLEGTRRSTTGMISAIVLGSNPEVERPDICVLGVLSLMTFAGKRALNIGVAAPRLGIREELALDVAFIGTVLGGWVEQLAWRMTRSARGVGMIDGRA